MNRAAWLRREAPRPRQCRAAPAVLSAPEREPGPLRGTFWHQGVPFPLSRLRASHCLVIVGAPRPRLCPRGETEVSVGGCRGTEGQNWERPGGYHVTLLARNAEGYASLCRILTEAHLGGPEVTLSAPPPQASPHLPAPAFQPIPLEARRHPRAPWEALERNAGDLFCLSGCRRGEVPWLLLKGRYREAAEAGRRYRDLFGVEHYYLELQDTRLPRSRRLNELLAQLAEHLGVGIVATNNVHYLAPEDFEVHDLLTCVRTLTRLEDLHPERPLNPHNTLKSSREMAELFQAYPRALTATSRIAEQCGSAIDLEARHYPRFPGLKEGESPFSRLCDLVFQGAREEAKRQRERGKSGLEERLRHELEIIQRLGVAEYFLVVWDVARYARERGIRYAGRGSAADSMVAYCLNITQVNSFERGLLFERFMSLERAQKPDIDIDFDARYRDDITRYVYETYGADRVATVCTYNTFHARSALRDLGKAMGFPEPELDRLAKRCPPFTHADDLKGVLERIPELRDSGIPFERFQKLFELAARVDGSPRFLSTHLGGVVISQDPLTRISPLQRTAKGVTVVQFDKDDIEDLGLIKLDLLCLRMLSAVEDTLQTLKDTGTPVDYERIPLDDEPTYELLRSGETIGAFQLESPAQRVLQSRLGADNIEDVVASVALIRPGPIAGNMVEPFIARRRGLEPVTYLHPKLEPILKKTFGVVLYQEQVIEIATAIAGFTPGESDRLRRVMTHARSRRDMEEIGKEFIRKAVERGCTPEVAETIFSYIVGYAGYGFCEAHAAAFGQTAYRTSYLLRHHPAAFFAALLSNQPMGYYPSNTLCLEARRRGVTVLPPDVNLSGRHFTVEEDGEGVDPSEGMAGPSEAGAPPPSSFILHPSSFRVSLSQVRGISQASVESILEARKQGPFVSLLDFCRRTIVPRDSVENLILCGAFERLHPNRRQLFWDLPSVLRAAKVEEGPLFQPGGRPAPAMEKRPAERRAVLEDFSDFEKFRLECEVLGLNVSCHVMSYYRERLSRAGVLSSAGLRRARTGEIVTVAGVVLRPHRPPTKSGRTVVFLSLEDELGHSDVTVFEDVYQQFGSFLFGCPALIIRGRVDRRGGGQVSVIAERVRDLPASYRQESREPAAPSSEPEPAPSSAEDSCFPEAENPTGAVPADPEEEASPAPGPAVPRRALLSRRERHPLGSRAAVAYSRPPRG